MQIYGMYYFQCTGKGIFISLITAINITNNIKMLLVATILCSGSSGVKCTKYPIM